MTELMMPTEGQPEPSAYREIESAHDVRDRSEIEQKGPNRKMRRAEEKFKEKEKKAAAAKKTKQLTKSEMIDLARKRQGLPPIERPTKTKEKEEKQPEDATITTKEDAATSVVEEKTEPVPDTTK